MFAVMFSFLLIFYILETHLCPWPQFFRFDLFIFIWRVLDIQNQSAFRLSLSVSAELIVPFRAWTVGLSDSTPLCLAFPQLCLRSFRNHLPLPPPPLIMYPSHSLPSLSSSSPVPLLACDKGAPTIYIVRRLVNKIDGDFLPAWVCAWFTARPPFVCRISGLICLMSHLILPRSHHLCFQPTSLPFLSGWLQEACHPTWKPAFIAVISSAGFQATDGRFSEGHWWPVKAR